jgi:hypothetical protein
MAGIAIGQADHLHLMALACVQCRSSASGKIGIIRMGAKNKYLQQRWFFLSVIGALVERKKSLPTANPEVLG